MADAETYFGLSLAYMRKGLIEQAMQSIASAVLLDPQRSMYLSYWGKMLHQIGRNDKALTVLDSAIRLDQQDPTPRLYKAIILRDLNRPGEAIRHLQVAQELNNNRGVYRSRSLLDKDLAVQNVDLSRLFTQLGLAEWAHKKAINSIKSDFTNVSAHILNAGAYAGVGDRAYALANEALLARLMQPANINAFSSFNSYTSLYET
ncbi:MAG: iron dicitrate transport regulator FecR, partial [Gammaproteobacteria bacterium]|nr:iron dicitrate transport regulator FecR [Gammaproteobacteria bacterium]